MSRKKDAIVRRSTAELEAMKAAGKTRSDWSAAALKPIADWRDPDDAMEPVDGVTTELPMPKRINAVLRSYVERVTQAKSR